jgi:hypothetical protein
MLIREKIDGTLEYFSLVTSGGTSYETVDYSEDTGRGAKANRRKTGSTATSGASSSEEEIPRTKESR